jgi:hypothetical protein
MLLSKRSLQRALQLAHWHAISNRSSKCLHQLNRRLLSQAEYVTLQMQAIEPRLMMPCRCFREGEVEGLERFQLSLRVRINDLLAEKMAERGYKQNTSTAAATAMEARVTDDAGSQVIFMLVCAAPAGPSVTHFPSSPARSSSFVAHLSSLNIPPVTFPPVTQSVAFK